MLRVHIKDITPQGLDVAEKMPNEYIGLTQDDYIYFLKPVDIKAKVSRYGNTVLAHVDAKGPYRTFCYRTDKELKREFKGAFDLDFEVTAETQYIDLGDDIRQEIILNLPMRVLSEDAPVVKGEEIHDDPGALPTYQPFKDLKLNNNPNKKK